MGDDLRVGIVDGRENAIGHRGAVEVHVRMHGSDHDIELRETLVVEVQGAVLENVHLGAGKHADSQAAFAGGVNSLDVLEHAFFVEAVGNRDGFAVVGQGDVFVAEGARRFGHLLDGVLAVAGGGVPLQVGADVFTGNELLQAGRFPGPD